MRGHVRGCDLLGMHALEAVLTMDELCCIRLGCRASRRNRADGGGAGVKKGMKLDIAERRGGTDDLGSGREVSPKRCIRYSDQAATLRNARDERNLMRIMSSNRVLKRYFDGGSG